MTLVRRCLDCPRTSTRARCEVHRSVVARQRDTHNPVRDLAVVRRARNAAIAAWVRDHGWTCPGDERHASHLVPPRNLTANHPIPLARGGAPVQAFEILCRAANSSLGTRGGGVALGQGALAYTHPKPQARCVRVPDAQATS